jgi:WD40 repeat protein
LSVTPESVRAEVDKTAFEKHSDAITDVEYSRGGDYVVSSSADRTVRVFEPDKGMAQVYYSSPPLPGIVTSAIFHPKGNLVVSGCDDGGVRLHTVTPPAIQLLGKFDAPARRPEFSADGKFVLAASGDKTVRIWQIDTPGEVVRITHEAPVTQATFRPVTNGDTYVFVTTATNGEVRCGRLDGTPGGGGQSDAILEPRHPGAAVSAKWSADGNWLATVGGGEVILWKWTNDLPVARLRMVELNSATSRAEFSPDAKLLVTYGADQVAYVWDITKFTAAP